MVRRIIKRGRFMEGQKPLTSGQVANLFVKQLKLQDGRLVGFITKKQCQWLVSQFLYETRNTEFRVSRVYPVYSGPLQNEQGEYIGTWDLHPLSSGSGAMTVWQA